MSKTHTFSINQAIAAQNRSGRGHIDATEARNIHRLLTGRHGNAPAGGGALEIPAAGPGGEIAMSKERFVQGLARLGYNVSTAHRLLGIGRTTIYRMSKGTSAVPEVVCRLIDMYERFGVPPEHKR
jgi:transcriptional regulator of acetoin/glycerol metabolism